MNEFFQAFVDTFTETWIPRCGVEWLTASVATFFTLNFLASVAAAINMAILYVS